MRVLINYKFTHKKLKLTQKVKITDTFFNLPFVLYLTLYSVDTFLALLLSLLLLLFSMCSYERVGWLGSRDLGFSYRDLGKQAQNFAI